MLKARDYQTGDVKALTPRGAQAVEVAAFEVAASPGNAWTITRNGDAIFCGGFQYSWEGLATIWTVWGDNLDARAQNFVARFCMSKVRACDARRLQALVRADYLDGLRFVHWVGLSVVCRLEAYGPDGSDYWLYARVRR